MKTKKEKILEVFLLLMTRRLGRNLGNDGI